MIAISRVTGADLAELLALVRAYCDFYEVAPSDDALLAVSHALIADPDREGIQLIARNGGAAVGFATLYWSWSTLIAARVGIMNDLYVAPTARGTGVADELIRASLRPPRRCASRVGRLRAQRAAVTWGVEHRDESVTRSPQRSKASR